MFKHVSRGLLIGAMSGAVVLGGAGMAHAASVHAGSTSTKLDYNIVQNFNPTGSVTDVTNVVYNGKGKLTGTGNDINDHCTFVFNGTVRKGGVTNFTMTFDAGTPCAGVIVTYTGTISAKSGSGTFTSTNGGSGTWTASDTTSNVVGAGSGHGNLR